MDFRTLVKQGLWIRVIDVLGHIGFGWALGSVFVQFLPDMLLPIIWLRSWKKNELLPETDLALELHRGLHTCWPSFLLICAYLVMLKPWMFWVSAQWLVHVAWDGLTHPEPEFKKSLWRFDVG